MNNNVEQYQGPQHLSPDAFPEQLSDVVAIDRETRPTIELLSAFSETGLDFHGEGLTGYKAYRDLADKVAHATKAAIRRVMSS